MIYLVEVQAHDGVTLRTFYLASRPFVTGPSETPPNQFYAPRVIGPGNFGRYLFARGSTRGQSDVGFGDITFTTGDGGDGQFLDDWLSMAFDGRSVVVKLLPDGVTTIASAVTLFRGVADQIASTNPLEEINLQLRDRLVDIDKPLLTMRYAGTMTGSADSAEGDENLKDQIKPWVYGIVVNMTAILANPFDLIYQVSAGTVASIAVFDGGHALMPFGNYATLALLRAAAVPPGYYGTCLAAGLFKLGALPEKSVTADVVEGSTLASRSAAQIARRMLLQFGLTTDDLPASSFTALDALNSAECGILIADEMSALEAATRVLGSIGAWLVPDRLGVFSVGRLSEPAGPPVAIFTEDQIIDLQRNETTDSDRGIATWQTKLKWGPAWTVQKDGDLVGTTSTARRTRVGTDWREALAENAALKIVHLNSAEFTVETYLANEADAVAESARLQALYGQDRICYQFTVHTSEATTIELGSVVQLQHPRLGLASGALFLVLGRDDDYADNEVTFDVWGAV